MLRFSGWLLIAVSFFLLPVGLSVIVDAGGRIVITVTLWRIAILRRMAVLHHPEAGRWTLRYYRGNGTYAGERVLFPPEKKKKRDPLRTLHFLAEAYRWEEFCADGIAASDDAAKTAVIYGILCAVFGGLDAAVGERCRIRRYVLVPSFRKKKGDLLFYGMFFTFPGKLITAAVRTGKTPRPNKTVPLPITVNPTR